MVFYLFTSLILKALVVLLSLYMDNGIGAVAAAPTSLLKHI